MSATRWTTIEVARGADLQDWLRGRRTRSRSISTAARTGSKTVSAISKLGLKVAGPTRLELATSGVTGRHSNQLNYDPAEGAGVVLELVRAVNPQTWARRLAARQANAELTATFASERAATLRGFADRAWGARSGLERESQR